MVVNRIAEHLSQQNPGRSDAGHSLDTSGKPNNQSLQTDQVVAALAHELGGATDRTSVLAGSEQMHVTRRGNGHVVTAAEHFEATATTPAMSVMKSQAFVGEGEPVVHTVGGADLLIQQMVQAQRVRNGEDPGVIIMLTNHGCHQLNLKAAGAPDTGGQNVYVNAMSEQLVNEGYKVLILNRGGFPHPVTKELHTGSHSGSSGLGIMYLEDSRKEFVRKEDMHEQIDELVLDMSRRLAGLKIHAIVSHYWDSLIIANKFIAERHENIPHFWDPHSTGSLKARNVNYDRHEGLRIGERIAVEQEELRSPYLTGLISTSAPITQSLQKDYHTNLPIIMLPPGIDTDRFHKRTVDQSDPLWTALQKKTNLPLPQLHKSQIIAEVSRTDDTKKKGDLIQAFASVVKEHPDALLVININPRETQLHKQLTELIDRLNIKGRVAVFDDFESKQIPTIYNMAKIYCTPSVMEGFGMSAQEAAACGIPVIATRLVPFAEEYLVGTDAKIVSPTNGGMPFRVGKGGITVEPNSPQSLAAAIKLLLSDQQMRESMGDNALKITIPDFAWAGLIRNWLEGSGLAQPGSIQPPKVH